MQNTLSTHLVLAILAAVAVPVLADADGPDFYRATGIPQGDVLNIRAAPKASAAKLGAISPGGTCIRNLGCRGGLSLREYQTLSPEEQARRQKQNPRWCHIEYNGVTGWVAGRYLGEGSCP
jgi:Bacterial SH3 domain